MVSDRTGNASDRRAILLNSITRRESLTAALGGLAAVLLPIRSPRADDDTCGPAIQLSGQGDDTKYFTAEGAGGYSGESWASAMPIAWLVKSLPFAHPGSKLLIGRKTKGEFIPLGKVSVGLKNSGTSGSPIQISAGSIGTGDALLISMCEQVPQFKGLLPWSIADGGKGAIRSFLVLQKGASHLNFSGFSVDGTSAGGFFRFAKDKSGPVNYQDITIQGISARNVGRLIETDAKTSIADLAVENCNVTGMVRGFARFRDLTNGTFRNLNLDAANMDGGGRNVCQIIAIQSCDGVLLENVVMKNAVNKIDAGLRDNGRGYVQGDGLVCEQKTKNITVRKCQAIGMGDGGYDLKTTNVTLEDSVADGCKFGIRIWSSGKNVIRRCDVRNPVSNGTTHGACLQVSGSVDVIDTKFQASGDTSALALLVHEGAPPPSIRMTGGSITLAEGAALAVGRPGATLELNNVTVNGESRTQRYTLDGTSLR